MYLLTLYHVLHFNFGLGVNMYKAMGLEILALMALIDVCLFKDCLGLKMQNFNRFIYVFVSIILLSYANLPTTFE